MASVLSVLRSAPPVGERERPIGLVVQGGGMRGVYSMAALAALEDAGMTEAFDYIVGSSAGAINGSYFLAKQANEAVRVYVDLLSNKNFVNPARVGRIVDIDFMVKVLRENATLDLDRIHNAATLLEVVVTDVASGKPVTFSNRDTDVDLYEIIRATSALPALYNKQVPLRAGLYIDGGASDGVPVKRAVDWGCRDILSVLTRRPGFRRLRKGWPYRSVGRAMARGQSTAVKALIGEEDVLFNTAMDLLEGKTSVSGGIRSGVVWPSDTEQLVGRTTFAKPRLEACAAMGRRDMVAMLNSEFGAPRQSLPCLS
jgi:predicted acylesterase/phospholipase RssA